MSNQSSTNQITLFHELIRKMKIILLVNLKSGCYNPHVLAPKLQRGAIFLGQGAAGTSSMVPHANNDRDSGDS